MNTMVTIENKCQSCGKNDLSIFYEAHQLPIHSCQLLSCRDEALLFPRRDISLGFCQDCGFIGNVIFDPQVMRYSAGYEEQQSFSSRFNLFARELAAHLVERYDLRHKTVVEIGCGKGDFLALLCELGNNRGIGIDPTYVPGRLQSAAADRITFIRDFYSPRYAELRGDLLCCRHTLEHLSATQAFVEIVRQTVGDRSDTVIFFEVPDVTRVLREGAFWDIYYEHCSYFSLGSLARLFRSSGFEVLDVAKAFDDQYLLLEARPGDHRSPGSLPQETELEQEALEQEARDVASFAEKYRASLDQWKRRFASLRENGQRTAIWGSSSKCVAFLSTLQIPDDTEYVVVDINPHRHGKYLPGLGKQILSPQVLSEYRPDLVISMNPIYSSEIRQDLGHMGLDPELIAV
jgi:SAM-dependent methyltransferase